MKRKLKKKKGRAGNGSKMVSFLQIAALLFFALAAFAGVVVAPLIAVVPEMGAAVLIQNFSNLSTK